VQVRVLYGSRGLLPIAAFLDEVRERATVFDLPTVFWLGASDGALVGAVVLGALAAGAALVGFAPRAMFAATTVLYLGFATAGRTFMGFQWDNLVLECGLCAAFLPSDRDARWIHVLFRLLLFKLYFESGIAKWQSDLGDWQDGSAMSYYYETAPLPTALGFFAHHLPLGWHRFESWATLVLELGVPFAFFGPRPARLASAAILTAFQLVNFATANYGFFVPNAIALHVFLLDDRDVDRLARRVPLFVRRAALGGAWSWPRRTIETAGAIALVSFFVVASVAEAGVHFFHSETWDRRVLRIRDLYEPWRLVNTYHLFGSITRERIEPEIQTTTDGAAWVAHDLFHKPGSPRRRPDFVAPHQPRVDFQLWFYGLSFERGAPEYVRTLLDRVCRDPDAVQSLFVHPLPPHPLAVRIVFWDYHFTTSDDRSASGQWWTRELLDETRPLRCGSP
jgi:hypothetical protein